jgi:CrcB protein
MFDWRTIAVVGVGAAIGGVLRLLVTQLVVARAGAPYVAYATLFINVSGSFLIGVVLGVAQARTDLSPLWRFFLATGILGGYTTFSTFSYEALTLGTSGSGLAAAAYAIGSITLGIAGAYAGLATARAFS